MKLITLLLSLVLMSPALAGLPPTTLNSQQSSVKNTTFNTYVPNNQATKITGGTLIESGNKTLLANPSFESPLVGGVIPSWNFGALAPVLEISSTVIDGKQLALFNASSQAVLLTQTSTLYASAFALGGTQGLASCRINSTAVLKMCTISNSVTSTSNCVDVNADGNWGHYKIPVILGTGDNGLSIASTGAVTGTVYVDDCFLGAQDLKQDTSTCNSIECETEFSAKVSITGVVSDESLDWLSGCTNSAGSGVCTFNTNVFTVTPNCSMNIRGAASGADRTVQINTDSASSMSFITVSNTTLSSLGFTLTCQKQGTDFTNAKRLGNNTTYSSQNADTDWASCGHTTSDFTGFGTVSAIETQCKRQGSDLLMRGKFTSGTSTAVEARLNLKLNGATLTSADTAKIPSIQALGAAYHDESTTSLVSKFGLEPSISYVTFLHKSPSTTTAYTKINGNAFVTSGKKVSLELRIPIAGWENSNQIIGSFKEVMTVPGVSKPVNFSFFYGSAGATFCTTSPCTVDQIGNIVTSMTRGSAGNYTINLDRTYSKVQCTYNGLSSGATSMGVSPTLLKCSNCSSLSIATQIPPAGAIADTLGSLVCVGSAP